MRLDDATPPPRFAATQPSWRRAVQVIASAAFLVAASAVAVHWTLHDYPSLPTGTFSSPGYEAIVGWLRR